MCYKQLYIHQEAMVAFYRVLTHSNTILDQNPNGAISPIWTGENTGAIIEVINNNESYYAYDSLSYEHSYTFFKLKLFICGFSYLPLNLPTYIFGPNMIYHSVHNSQRLFLLVSQYLIHQKECFKTVWSDFYNKVCDFRKVQILMKLLNYVYNYMLMSWLFTVFLIICSY